MPGIKRMPIKATRALLNAALDGSLNNAEFRKDPNFGFEVPVAVAGRRHADCSIRAAPGPMAAEYDATAHELVQLFVDNFAQFADARRRRRAPGRACIDCCLIDSRPAPRWRNNVGGQRFVTSSGG